MFADASPDTVQPDGLVSKAPATHAVNGSLSTKEPRLTAPRTVAVADDNDPESEEHFSLQLSNPGNGAAITANRGRSRILDNKSMSLPTFLVNDVSDLIEGEPVEFTVSLLLPTGITGNFEVLANTESAPGLNAAQANEDYFPASPQWLSLSNNDPSATVIVNTSDDVIGEATETFTLRISQPSNNAVIGDGEGRARLIDNDGGLPKDTFGNGFNDGFE